MHAWKEFEGNFLAGKRHELPFKYELNQDTEATAIFLREQWNFARNLYIEAMEIKKDFSLTPFLKDCKAVIEDREIYLLKVPLNKSNTTY